MRARADSCVCAGYGPACTGLHTYRRALASFALARAPGHGARAHGCLSKMFTSRDKAANGAEGHCHRPGPLPHQDGWAVPVYDTASVLRVLWCGACHALFLPFQMKSVICRHSRRVTSGQCNGSKRAHQACPKAPPAVCRSLGRKGPLPVSALLVAELEAVYLEAVIT